MNKEERLLKRIDRNYADYRASILRMDEQEIFKKAEEIAAYKQMYDYLSDRHQFEPEQLDYLLLFQNPLEVLTDQYKSGRWNIDDTLEGIAHEACDKQDALADYPLMNPKEKER
jgi:regulatory protein YycH of two-component signal transduction system YycFG